MSKRTDDQIMRDLSDLYNALSPENLHCDGEISRTAAQRKYRKFMKIQKALFKELGRTVSEEETWNYVEKLPPLPPLSEKEKRDEFITRIKRGY